MTASPFAAPATTSGIDWKTVNGALLYIEPLNSEKVTSNYGESDVVRSNIVVLDGPSAGDRYDDCLVFPKVLANQLRPKIGEKVLGRLGQGQAKLGQSAPWLLAEATAADIEVGVAYINQQASGQLQPPAPQQAPATNTGGQPPF
ncbi:hypothetical protein [Arthrobacter agilis]|uniref:hypothetical protein n=1 Tax=Arthrobacter agilis TaxID=37921 RepID=UPI00278054B2|nr:hypothetical protein [Arthrobacter agilis]MDQ0735308.1 hypothetical protein [Arthrobacter agilis]